MKRAQFSLAVSMFLAACGGPEAANDAAATDAAAMESAEETMDAAAEADATASDAVAASRSGAGAEAAADAPYGAREEPPVPPADDDPRQ